VKGERGPRGAASAVPVDGQLCADAGLFFSHFLAPDLNSIPADTDVVPCLHLSVSLESPQVRVAELLPTHVKGPVYTTLLSYQYISSKSLLHPSMTYMQGNGACTQCDASALMWKVECITLYSVEISHVISLGFSPHLFLPRRVMVPVVNGPKESECVAK
jgi:hypothetical protein